MGYLDGRVAIITGGGRGIGRQHALLFAAEGARVMVNDLGTAMDGARESRSPAQEVVEEIRESGGVALANNDDISTWSGARILVSKTLESFGDLHILVNNAGILPMDPFIEMTEEQWNNVIDTHLKGHYATTRFAACYWSEQARAGNAVNAAVINTTSEVGTFSYHPLVGYGSAKAGIAAMTLIAANELSEYGVRVNAIAPSGRTRMNEAAPQRSEVVRAPDDSGQFDVYDPANVSPLVAWLASRDCTVSGHLFHIRGGLIQTLSGWTLGKKIVKDSRWTIDELNAEMPAII